VIELSKSNRLSFPIYSQHTDVLIKNTHTQNDNDTAAAEMEMYTNLFNKMAYTCYEKCASRKHKEPDLALGEMSCTDRCVSKYLEAHDKVGSVLQKANETQAKMQQSQIEMQNAFGGGAGR
jgi:import inner membrane translocase subunit TIM10